MRHPTSSEISGEKMGQDIEKSVKRGKPKSARKGSSVIHLRQCIVCRCRKSPELLTRLVVIEGQLVIDSQRLQPGRGAHVCETETCIAKLGKKGLLNHAFRLEARRKAEKRTDRRATGETGERFQGLKSSSTRQQIESLIGGQRSSDSISAKVDHRGVPNQAVAISGVDAVMEKLLARINDKDSHI